MKSSRFAAALAVAALGVMSLAAMAVPASATAVGPSVKMVTPTYQVGSTFVFNCDEIEFCEQANEVLSWKVTGPSVCSQTLIDNRGVDGVETSPIAAGARSDVLQYQPDQYGDIYSMRTTFCNGSAVTSNKVNANIALLDDSDTDDATYSGTWSVSNCQCAVEGTSHFTTQRNDSVSFTAHGEFGLIMDRGSNRGSAAIYVDGVQKATINTFSNSPINSTFVYSTVLPGGTHTVSVVNLATPGHPRIDFDAEAAHCGSGNPGSCD